MIKLIFRFFAPTKKGKLTRGALAAIFNFSKTLHITCTSPYGGERDSKIWIISDIKFLRPQIFLELTSGGHFKFWWHLKKTLAHPHVARNVKISKKIDQ